MNTTNPTELTDEQLQAQIAEAATKAAQAQAEAQAPIDALQAEQQRRAAEAQAAERKAREDWASWFIDGGGFTQVAAQLNDESKEARNAFIQALKDSPVGQAAARYHAAVSARQHANDLKTEAANILGRATEFNHVEYTNRVNLTADTVKALEKEADRLAAEKWDELSAQQIENTERDWTSEHVTEDRIERYEAFHADYGKPVKMIHNYNTGKTTIDDPAFEQWKKRDDEARKSKGPLTPPPAWTNRLTPAEAAAQSQEQTRPHPTHDTRANQGR